MVGCFGLDHLLDSYWYIGLLGVVLLFFVVLGEVVDAFIAAVLR